MTRKKAPIPRTTRKKAPVPVEALMPPRDAHTHIVWMVEHVPIADGACRAMWTKIGTARTLSDDSLAVTLSAIPVGGGEIVIRRRVP